MPLSNLHKSKRMKNYAMLAAIFIWIAVIFAVSVIRMK